MIAKLSGNGLISWKEFHGKDLTLNVPCISESCIEIKNSIFTLLCGASTIPKNAVQAVK